MNMTKVLRVIYFGGSIGLYMNDKLYAYQTLNEGGIYELFHRSLDLLNISRVEKYGISEESEFWDTQTVTSDWLPPKHFETIQSYCQLIEPR